MVNIENIMNKAVSLLKGGDVVACPTETVYGLFGDATSDVAVQKIYYVKGRPSCNPLIVHVASVDMVCRYAKLDNWQFEIISHFWDELKAPITFVVQLEKTSGLSNLVTAGLSTVAIRQPNHNISLDLIKRFGKPLAAPSANTSTSVSPTSCDMVVKDIGRKIGMVIDGGQCSVGLESTILDITIKDQYQILRHGGISKEEVGAYIGPVAECNHAEIIKAPGMMKRHYAPSIPLRMNAAYPVGNEAFIAFGKTNIKFDFNLSESGNLQEAARNLFSVIKKFDNPSIYCGIAIVPIPKTGIGAAINDRLNRASYREL